MEAGALRHKVTIQTPTRTENDLGEMELGWTNGPEVWAAVRPASAREVMRAQQTETQLTHVVTIRYTATVKPDCRLKFGTRILNITGILNPDERNRELVIHTAEAVNAV